MVWVITIYLYMEKCKNSWYPWTQLLVKSPVICRIGLCVTSGLPFFQEDVFHWLSILLKTTVYVSTSRIYWCFISLHHMALVLRHVSIMIWMLIASHGYSLCSHLTISLGAVVLIILISHYLHRFANLLGSNPIYVLATLILLSNLEILHTSVAVVHFTWLKYTTHNRKV